MLFFSILTINNQPNINDLNAKKAQQKRDAILKEIHQIKQDKSFKLEAPSFSNENPKFLGDPQDESQKVYDKLVQEIKERRNQPINRRNNHIPIIQNANSKSELSRLDSKKLPLRPISHKKSQENHLKHNAHTFQVE